MKATLLTLTLVLTLNILAINGKHINTLWRIQRTYQRDIIHTIPGDLRCSDVDGARADGWNGVCSCPVNRVFHVNNDGTAAKCFSKDSLCEGQQDGRCNLGYGWTDYKPLPNGETRLVLRYVSKASEINPFSEGFGGIMSEWYGNHWRTIQESNHLEMLENERFSEVLLPKEKIESGILRLQLWCNKTISKSKKILYLRLLQNATYLYPPTLSPPTTIHKARNKTGEETKSPKPSSNLVTTQQKLPRLNDSLLVTLEHIEQVLGNKTALETQLENEMRHKDLLLVIIIGVVAGFAIFLLIIIITIAILRRSRAKENESISPTSSTHTSTSTFYDTDIVYANPASMNLSRKADSHEPRKHAHYEEDHQQTYATLEGDGFHPQGYQTLTDHRSSITSTRSMIPTEEGGFYQQGYQTLTNHRNSVTSIREVIPEESGFYQQGYQTLTNHRASINSIREVIPEEDGFQQQGYQTLTNHRNSVNSIQEVIPEEGGFHSQSLKGQRPSVNSINNVILEEGRFHSQNVKGQRPCVNSTQGIINTNVSEENEEPVENEYFETEEIYHDPNDFDFKNTSNQEKKENDLEPFYFQTDIAVQSHQHIRPNLNLPLHTRNYANDEEIYVNNDPFESPVEENGPYAYSTVNKAWITPDDENNSEIVNNDFETDFNSFTIV